MKTPKLLLLLACLVAMPLAAAAQENEETPSLWTDGITADNDFTFSGGNGSQGEPYLIATAQDLAQLAVNVNNGNKYIGIYFLQTANIDLAGKYWIPIADGVNEHNNSFSGHYNGDYHVVSNMKIKASLCNTDSKHFLGLFAWIYKGSLRNLGVTNGEVLVDNRRDDDAALLLGYADANAIVDRCFATGRVETTDANNVAIGGLMGKNYDNGNITNCYFIGKLVSAGNTRTGGLLPNAQTTVLNCYVAATFENSASNQYALAPNHVTNCYYDNILNPSITEGKGTGKPTEEMKTAEMAAALGEAFAYDTKKNNGYPYIIGFEVFGSNVTSIAGKPSAAIVSAASGRIVCSEECLIFNALGQNVTAQNGNLVRGIYIVKTASTTQKVMLF